MSDTVAAREPSGGALGWVALVLGLVAAWSGFNAFSYASDALLEGTISEGQSVGLIYGLWAGAILLGLPASVLGLRAGFGSGMANKGELAGMWGWMLGAAASSAIIALMAYGFLGRPLAEALDDGANWLGAVGGFLAIVIAMVAFFAVPFFIARWARGAWARTPDTSGDVSIAPLTGPLS